MVKKREMTAAVNDLKEQMSAGSKDTAPRIDKKRPIPTTAEIGEEDHPPINEVERLLNEHGVHADELKGLAENFLNEFKDLSAKKPLLTATGAFLLGFLAGRASRK